MKATRFILYTKHDTQGEPPRIYIWDEKEQATVGELFFEPVPLVEDPDTFSSEHWDFPEESKKMLDALNECIGDFV